MEDKSQLISAVVEAASKMPRLKKASTNQYAGYNYVSIDDYYEKAAPVAYSCGLTWTLVETSPPVLIAKNVLLFTYRVDLYHVSGQSVIGYAALSVPHGIQGAQTAGSAMSYAAKCFLRSAFSLVTGEGDADETNQSDVQIESAPSDQGGRPPAPVETTSPHESVSTPTFQPSRAVPDMGEMEVILAGRFGNESLPIFHPPTDSTYPLDLAAECMIGIAPSVIQMDNLMEWWRQNMPVTDAMKVHDPEMYKSVKAMFEAQRKKLKGVKK